MGFYQRVIISHFNRNRSLFLYPNRKGLNLSAFCTSQKWHSKGKVDTDELTRSTGNEEEHDEVPEIEKCYYKTLGVEESANTQEIKEAFHTVARRYHPDRNPKALEYFTHVTKAYETLVDDQKRAVYDEERMTDEEFFKLHVGPFSFSLIRLFWGTTAAFSWVWCVLYRSRKKEKLPCGP